jgi:hypothetical protein
MNKSIWKDGDHELMIEQYDKSMLKITMFNTFDINKFDTAYLSKSDVIGLINYLNNIVDDMGYMFNS